MIIDIIEKIRLYFLNELSKRKYVRIRQNYGYYVRSEECGCLFVHIARCLNLKEKPRKMYTYNTIAPYHYFRSFYKHQRLLEALIKAIGKSLPEYLGSNNKAEPQGGDPDLGVYYRNVLSTKRGISLFFNRVKRNV